MSAVMNKSKVYQVNVKYSKNDLDWGESLKLISKEEALSIIAGTNRKYTQISAKFHVMQERYVRGCRKCQEARKPSDNFCSKCGSKISKEAISIPKIVGKKWITLHRGYNGQVYMDDHHPYADRSSRKCTLTLDYFLSIKYWYVIDM